MRGVPLAEDGDLADGKARAFYRPNFFTFLVLTVVFWLE